MADRETYLAELRALRGPDVPEDMLERIEAALNDPKKTPYELKNLCRMVAWKTVDAYPREAIDWHPTVDSGKCIGCGKCLAYCRFDVFDEVDGKPVPARPLNCVVLCAGCKPECPVDAITFPDYGTYEGLLKRLREGRA